MRLKHVAVFAGIAVLTVACTTTGNTVGSTVDGEANQTATTATAAPNVASIDVQSQGVATNDATSDTTTTIGYEFKETTATLAEASAPTTTTSQPAGDITDLLDDLNDLLSDLDGLLTGLEDESVDLDGAMNQNEGDIEG